MVALGSLLFIAWKLYFRDTELGASWDSWWEREVKELRDRAPPGSTVRTSSGDGRPPGSPSRMGKEQGDPVRRLGKVHGVWVPSGCSPGHLHLPPWGVRSPLGAHPAGEGCVGWGEAPGSPRYSRLSKGTVWCPYSSIWLGKGARGLGGAPCFKPAPKAAPLCCCPPGGVEAGAGAGAGRSGEEQRPALHLQPDGQETHPPHPGLQLCPAARRGAGDGPAGG